MYRRTDEQRRMGQDQTRRDRSFISELVPDWRPTREQALWMVRSVIVLAILLSIFTLIGLPFGITLWEWAKLLIVPAVIAGGGIWFNGRQQARDQQNAERRAQDDALEAYLDRMTELITSHHLGSPKSDDDKGVRVAARARTLTVLGRVDGNRAGSVVRFLYESDLITKDRCVVSLYSANLKETNLHGIILKGASLRGADLQGANPPSAEDRVIEARIQEQHLARSLGALVMQILWGMLALTFGAPLGEWLGARTRGSSLGEYDLGGPNLEKIDLEDANLEGANLKGANLKGANLREALLSRANLFGANLEDACLQNANPLRKAPSTMVAKIVDALDNPIETLQEWVKERENRKKLVPRFTTFVLGRREADVEPSEYVKALEERIRLAAPNLEEANLKGANLRGANLVRANFKGANLEKAEGFTNERLQDEAASLEGAIMPDGQKYEDWLKDKEGSGKDVENE